MFIKKYQEEIIFRVVILLFKIRFAFPFFFKINIIFASRLVTHETKGDR